MIRLLVVSMIATALFVGCSDDKVIDDQVMVETFVHLMVNQEAYKKYPDSLKIKTREVFENAGISEEDYLKTLESYKDDKEIWDGFFKDALTYVDSLRRNENVRTTESSSK